MMTAEAAGHPEHPLGPGRGDPATANGAFCRWSPCCSLPQRGTMDRSLFAVDPRQRLSARPPGGPRGRRPERRRHAGRGRVVRLTFSPIAAGFQREEDHAHVLEFGHCRCPRQRHNSYGRARRVPPRLHLVARRSFGKERGRQRGRRLPNAARGRLSHRPRVAVGMSHPLGVGNSYFRIGAAADRWVDTVPFGCYRREVFDRIGLFDEELVRNQDDELNLRLIKHGGRILLSPRIVCKYYARDSLAKLWRMYYQYGYFKPLVVRKLGGVMTCASCCRRCFCCAFWARPWRPPGAVRGCWPLRPSPAATCWRSARLPPPLLAVSAGPRRRCLPSFPRCTSATDAVTCAGRWNSSSFAAAARVTPGRCRFRAKTR